MATIRSVVRALTLLRAMSESREFSLRELHYLTGLPKPTVFRILSTLQAAGYVLADHPVGAYRLSAKVRELGNGYTDKSLIVEVAAPIARAVTAKIKWPLAIGILEGFEIGVRYSTMPESPFAVQSTTLGHRHGLLESAMGQAYLGFCSAAERNVLIGVIRKNAQDLSVDPKRVSALVAAVRKQGYGLRMPKKKGDSGTMAVPIRQKDRVLAILSMTTFGILMNAETIARYRPILVDTAQEIAHRFAEQAHTPDRVLA